MTTQAGWDPSDIDPRILRRLDWGGITIDENIGRPAAPLQPNTMLPVGNELGLGGAGIAPTMPQLPINQPQPQRMVPWTQDVARILLGAASGMAGQQNPVIQLEQQQQRLEQQGQALRQEMFLRERTAALAEQRERRLEKQMEVEREDKLRDVRVGLAKTLLAGEDEAGVRAGLGMLRQEGVFNLPENLEKEFIGAKLAKSYQQRLDASIYALDVGVDPKDIGVQTAGIDIEKLRAMPLEQRALLASPDAQKRALEASEKKVEIAAKTLVADIKRRMAEGLPVSFAEKKVAGMAPKNMDEYATEIVMDHYSDPKRPLKPMEQQVVSSYMMQQRLKGLTGESQLAMRAAGGDAEAKKAFAMLNQEQRRMTEIDLIYQAGQIKAKMEANPTYAPTIPERGVLASADLIAERKSARPLPNAQVKSFSTMKVIADQMNVIDEAIGAGGLKHVGPVAGRAGKWAEMIGGPLHDKVRSQLYTAVDTLFSEIGPEKFGGQFTGPEQKIVRDFKAELTSPSGQFTVRHEAFRDMMRRKYETAVSMAKTNKYRLPEDFEEVPEGLAPKSPKTQSVEDKAKQRAKALFLEGKTPQQVREQLRKEGF